MLVYPKVSALHALAAKGVNIITVLHQPSYPLYQMYTVTVLDLALFLRA